MIQSADAKTLAEPRKRLFGWALLLGVVSHQAAHGHLASVDQTVASWMAAMRSPFLDGVMRAVTFFGSSLWAVAALAGLSVLAWRRGGRPGVFILVAAFIVSFVMEVSLRLSVAQWRPDTLSVPASMDWQTRFALAGFPSGHAVRSAFIFGWLSEQVRGLQRARLIRLLCLLFVGLVGFSRLYLNRHWASDVMGAWLVVMVALSVARLWEQSLWARSSRQS